MLFANFFDFEVIFFGFTFLVLFFGFVVFGEDFGVRFDLVRFAIEFSGKVVLVFTASGSSVDIEILSFSSSVSSGSSLINSGKY